MLTQTNKGFMMLKNTIIALTLLSLSLTASAEGEVGAGFGSLSKSFDDNDISFNLIYISVAYNLENSEGNYFIMPEVRVYRGMNEESVYAYDKDTIVELNTFISISIRAQYDFSNGAYAYVRPSFSNFTGKLDYSGLRDPGKIWELGIGAGLGYNINKNISLEASFEKYDDTDLLSVGFKYAF